MNRLIISPETLEKIKELKKLENITKNTSYIEKLVNDKYNAYKFDLEYYNEEEIDRQIDSALSIDFINKDYWNNPKLNSKKLI